MSENRNKFLTWAPLPKDYFRPGCLASDFRFGWFPHIHNIITEHVILQTIRISHYTIY